MMIIPLILGALCNSFIPQAIEIGGFTTDLLKNGVNAFVAMFFVCSGSQIKLREAATPLVRGTVLCAAKIAIGGVVFLSLDNRIIGSALFTIGLFTVCAFGLNLFTGKVCYALENGRSYNLALPLIWLGNLVGTGITALIVRLSRIDGIAAKAAELCAVKLDDRLLSLFLLSTLCNVFIYIAVEGYKNNPHELGKYLSLFFGVMVLILAGTEHCVADMLYFHLSGWSADAAIAVLVISIGNAAGGMLFRTAHRFVSK